MIGFEVRGGGQSELEAGSEHAAVFTRTVTLERRRIDQTRRNAPRFVGVPGTHDSALKVLRVQTQLDQHRGNLALVFS
jgi:hypothetical protein